VVKEDRCRDGVDEQFADGQSSWRKYLRSRSGKIGLLFFAIIGIFLLGIFAFYSMNVFATHEGSGGVSCWNYDGNYSGCVVQVPGCAWANNSGATPTNSFCSINISNYNATGAVMNYSNKTGDLLINAGCCIGAGGGAQGCWSFDGTNLSTCEGDATCSWKANDANQNPWCSNNKGCCNKKGCWSFNGANNNSCFAALGGNACRWANKSQDQFCSDLYGCCYDKNCNEVSTQQACNDLKNNLGKPCVWNESNSNTCGFSGGNQGGGFGFYNSSDSCLTQGGWWNASGSCVMPGEGGGGGGAGGFMFAQEARCWFADNKQTVCGNVSGCVYCSTNTTIHGNNASSACYSFPSGSCQGHETKFTNWNGTTSVNITDINVSSMTCGDVRLKQTCNCGPLPNCVWNNGSAITGNYCTVGVKSNSDTQSCQPPVQFCEDPKAKNNQTLCEDLANTYMMPCKYEGATGGKNCTFSSASCFGAGSSGSGGGGLDYTTISNEVQCLAAGGTWRTEYYTDGGALKQDGWCEKGALFSFTSGKAFANKGNCDSDCWACEFNASGSNYGGNVTAAQAACLNSKKGICKWKNDSSSPNSLGRCDYPQEFSFGGATDCGKDCKACDFFANPSQACASSIVGCGWVNDSSSPKGGFCQSSSKKSCSSDCFSCGDQNFCSNSSNHPGLNCSWDPAYYFCKPMNFAGEICFNGKDDDSDTKIDCADPDCTFDQFCGGSSIGSSGGTDCKKQATVGSCTGNNASSGKACVWVTPPWGGSSYCDFPGSSCWLYESNVTGCTTGIGCEWKNSSSFIPFTGFCEINKTNANVCFNSTNFNNQTRCAAGSDCQWVVDAFNPSGGRCDFRLFASCSNRTSSSTCCTSGNCNLIGGNCTWRNDSYSFNGGFCDPICFTAGLNSSQCSVQSASGSGCAFRGTTCEPDLFATGGGGGGGNVGCHQFDTNYTACIKQNLTCAWMNFTMGGVAGEGFCDSKGQLGVVNMMDQSPPKIIGFDPNESTIPGEIDIREYGIKDSLQSLSLGILVRNMTNASVCRGYYLGGGFGSLPLKANGTAPTKFYFYLDTNANKTDNCNATYQNGSIEKGYEFLIKYLVSFSNGSVTETKSFLKCSGGTWVLTNVPLSSNRQMMCSISVPAFGADSPKLGGVAIIVDKESLESFSTYNKTTPMRVLVSSANETYTEVNPLDSPAAAGYYTPGTADFKFVDCSNPDTKDDKCKNFQKFGFNIYEDCKNGQDDDGDGLADCGDPKCGFTPSCAGGNGFNFTADPNDKTTPSLTFSNVEITHVGSTIKFDSNEPANGSLDFYRNDSTCTTVNMSIAELGDPAVTFDNYKPFHAVPLELNTLGYDLTNGTTYYYKTTLCDVSGNCATSACLNFTTKTENSFKNFVFKLKLPSGFNVTIPALNYSGNFTTTVGGKTYENGIKANASITRGINVTVNCGESQSLTFVGVDILKPKSIDMTTAFVCDSATRVLGMNSSSKSWNQVVSDLGMGGYSDYVKLTFPLAYSADNNISWCNDALTNCTNVNSFANCSSGGGQKTDCKIPTSLGFSTYQVSVPGSSSSSTTSSGGGGGGGAAATGKTYAVSESQISSGYTQSLVQNDKVKFPVGGVDHTVTATQVTATSVKITVASTPQTATLSVGQSAKFDVNDNKVYDVQVTLNSISGTKASVTVKGISEAIPAAPAQPATTEPAPSPPAPSEPSGEKQVTGGTGATAQEKGTGRAGVWLIAAIAVIALIAWAVIWVSKRKR